jgi:WD40 repeat protein
MKFPRPKFSLRTLLILVLLIGSAGGLWHRWAPWALEKAIAATYAVSSVERTRFITVEEKLEESDDVALWDFESLREICRIHWAKQPDERHFYSIQGDGRWVYANACMDTTPSEMEPIRATLFDAQTGKEILDNKREARRVRVLRGGQKFVVFYEKGSPELWDAERGRLYEINDSHVRLWFGGYDFDHHYLNYLFFTPDGKRMMCSWRNTIKTWDSETGKQLHQLSGWSFGQHGEEYILPDGHTLIYGTHQGDQACNLITAESRKSFFDGYFVENALSPDGRFLITRFTDKANGNETVQVYDATSKLMIHKFDDVRIPQKVTHRGPGHPTMEVLMPTSVRAQWAEDRALIMMEIRDQNYVIDLKTKKSTAINFGEAISPDGKRVMARDNNSFNIVDADTGKFLCTLYEFKSHSLTQCMGFSADGSRAAFVSGETLEIWRNRRPEAWWGIAWLPEAWLVLVTGLGLVWSLARDWKGWRRAAAGETV